MIAYFCWLCERQVQPGAIVDWHIKNDRWVRFCSEEHHAVFRRLKKAVRSRPHGWY